MFYSAVSRHSPITEGVATRLREIAAKNPSRDITVFMKVGDSISYSHWFMNCFAPDQTNVVMDLGEHAELQPTVDYFAATLVDGGTTSLDRLSVSTKVGATANWPMAGAAPVPLDSELNALNPRFAIVMYGTNDLNYSGSEEGLRAWAWRHYGTDLFAIVDRLIAGGIVPVVSTIPYSGQHPTKAPVINAIVRGIAQARQIPLVDYYQASRDLPNHGLGGDEVHPSIYVSSGVPRGCFLTPEGLTYGYNVRNLVSLEALSRLRAVVADQVPALDDHAVRAGGSGTEADPIRVHELPFTDMRPGVAAARASYGCDGGAPSSGAETVYKLTLTETTALRALVLRPGGYAACENDDLDCSGVDDVSVTLVSNNQCLTTNNTWFGRTLPPGTYTFVVDQKVPSGDASLFVVMRCEPGDAQCR